MSWVEILSVHATWVCFILIFALICTGSHSDPPFLLPHHEEDGPVDYATPPINFHGNINLTKHVYISEDPYALLDSLGEEDFAKLQEIKLIMKNEPNALWEVVLYTFRLGKALRHAQAHWIFSPTLSHGKRRVQLSSILH